MYRKQVFKRPAFARPVSSPPSLRRELSALIFDALVDGWSREKVREQILIEARTDQEITAAMARFGRAEGVLGKAVAS